MSAQHRKSLAGHAQLRRLVSATVSAALALLAVFALLLVVLGLVTRPDKAGISRLAGHPVLSVLSGSMTPAFRAGDLVVDNAVSRDQAARLAPGDIITFHVPGPATELVTHRIVAVQHPTETSGATSVRYQTKGDANDSPDIDSVSPGQVVGTYRMRVAYGGYVLRAAQTKTVYFFLILLPLLYLIGSEVAKRWREPAVAEPRRETESDAVGATDPNRQIDQGQLTVGDGPSDIAPSSDLIPGAMPASDSSSDPLTEPRHASGIALAGEHKQVGGGGDPRI